ncbi:MAG: DUF2809 domain-containing protein [Clostridia bacterium]|nr:DUF2809 domain-containing protein [Clostridia bacterium]
MRNKQLRLYYCVAAVLLLGIEVCIALFVHDAFVRPYVGDALVVIVIYCLIRIVFPRNPKLLPLYVFLFSAGVEFLQYFDFVNLLGLGHIRFFRVLIGATFDGMDILCYAVGCLFLGIYEIIIYNKRKKLG